MNDLATTEPIMKCPADWVKAQRINFCLAAVEDAPANAIMDVLRAMEIWARENHRDMETVEIVRVHWCDNRLVVSFK